MKGKRMSIVRNLGSRVGPFMVGVVVALGLVGGMAQAPAQLGPDDARPLVSIDLKRRSRVVAIWEMSTTEWTQYTALKGRVERAENELVRFTQDLYRRYEARCPDGCRASMWDGFVVLERQ